MPTLIMLLLVSAASVAAPLRVSAQDGTMTQADVVNELRRLRAELDEARRELATLRTDVTRLKGGGDAWPDDQAALPIDAAVEVLQAQMAEHAQTKVESASRFPVTLFGTIQSNVAANTGEANWLDNPNLVPAPPPFDTGSFTASMRQTRLGLRTHGLAIGDWQASGAVVFDFFGGVPAFQAGQAMSLPRLVYGFARFDRAGTAIEVGQDEMMLAPRNPTSIAAFSFPLLFRSGNLYLRAPQARLESRLAGDDTGEVRAMVGIVAPIGGDFLSPNYTFVPPALGGERSRLPGVQARVAWQSGDDTRGSSLGGSGPYSRERPADELLTSWAAAVDFHLQGARVGVAGELFVGDNLDAFGGALGQPVKASGGFLEARLRPADRWEFVLGGGTDRPDEAATLSRNDAAYGSVIFRVTPEVATSVEYRWLETRAAAARRRNTHVNWAVTYSF
jgi:hypothetical protein